MERELSVVPIISATIITHVNCLAHIRVFLRTDAASHISVIQLPEKSLKLTKQFRCDESYKIYEVLGRTAATKVLLRGCAVTTHS